MSDTNAAQAEYWNSAAGQKWLTHETALDATMSGILQRLLDRTNIQPGERLLDIGCGTGVSTCRAAYLTGPGGHVTGLDIAPIMLERARTRSQDASLTNTAYLLADAQTHKFSPGSVDAILSRFGMMFFNDPTAAFTNIAKCLRPCGRLVFAAWGPLSDNPWFRIPGAVAVQRLGKPAPSDPTAPGPLAFQDRQRVADLMEKAGLQQIRAENETVPLASAYTVTEISNLACKVGTAVRVMQAQSATAEDAKAIETTLNQEFKQFETETGTAIPASINFFSAKVPG